MSSLLFDILRSLHHIINAHSLENLKLASTVQRIIFLTKLSPLSTKAMPPSQNGMVNNWPQGFHGIFVVSNFVAFFITMTTDIFCKLTKIIFSVFSILCLKWEVLGIYYSKSTFEQKSSWSKVVSSILIHLEKYWEIDISYSLKRTIFKFKRWRTKRSNEVSFFKVSSRRDRDRYKGFLLRFCSRPTLFFEVLLEFVKLYRSWYH